MPATVLLAQPRRLSNFVKMNPAVPFRPKVINCISQTDLDKIKSDLRNRAYRIFELDRANIHDKNSFFLQAAKDLPQPPELIAENHWDALKDNLWWSLSEISETKVGILWSNAHRMLNGGLADLFLAVNCFEQLAKSVAVTGQGFSHPITLHIFLLGKGNNFPAYSGRFNR